MYSDLVEQLAQSLNKKDLILTGSVYVPNSNSELSIFGMCKLEDLEHSLQALSRTREMWTLESTMPKPNSVISVRIRNINAAIKPELLQHHPVLCTVDLDNLYEGLVAVPQLS